MAEMFGDIKDHHQSGIKNNKNYDEAAAPLIYIIKGTKIKKK